jgi:hypothetical protein
VATKTRTFNVGALNYRHGVKTSDGLNLVLYI